MRRSLFFVLFAAVGCGAVDSADDADPEEEVTSFDDALSPNGTFFIEGTRLKDANGNDFVLRGFNVPYAWWDINTAINGADTYAATGANAIRLAMLTDTTADQLRSALEQLKRHNLIGIPEMHDAYGSDDPNRLNDMVRFWTRPDIKQVMLDYKRWTILNIANEWMGTWNNHDTYQSAYARAIRDLRAAGLPHVLMIDAAGWGQEHASLVDRGDDLLRVDPNLLLSVHMYDVFSDGPKVKSAFDQLGRLPIAIGEFGHWHGSNNVDEDTILREARARGIGWLAWSWIGNGDEVKYLDMSKSWNALDLTWWGSRVVDGADGLRQTAATASVFGSGGGGGGFAEGTYKIISAHSGKSLDDAGANPARGADIQQWRFIPNNAAQTFYLGPVGDGSYVIKPASGWKCVEVVNWSKADGADVRTWDCLDNPNQQWFIEDRGGGQYQLRNKDSNKCMDVLGFSRDDGGNVGQWRCTGGANQRWAISRL